MLECSWLIKAGENQVVEVGIVSMNSDSDCLQDHLSLFNGPTQADREIARICGQAISKKFSSTGPEMYIQWHNDNPSKEKQVVFSYRVKDRKLIYKLETVCFQYITLIFLFKCSKFKDAWPSTKNILIYR